jgi:3-oxoacyl-[acyl-carrier protein] reductase
LKVTEVVMRNIPMHFSGNHACILGASSGLGMAVAQLLSDAGFRLTLSACSHDGLERIASAFPEATVVELNLETVARSADTEQQSQLRNIDSPDYLVDCMQSDFEAFISGAEPARIAQYMETNISGRAICLRHLSRLMLAKRFGRCVFISSTAAALPNAGQGFYAAAKLAGEALYQNLGVELGGRGVTSCSFRIGYVESGRGATFLEKNPQAVQRSPAKRAMTPDEISHTVAFLLSDAAHMINGTTVTMDGGLTACK